MDPKETDLNASDIDIQRCEPRPGYIAHRANLGFLSFTTKRGCKAYQALGDTPAEAKNNLIDIMVEHLLRLKE